MKKSELQQIIQEEVFKALDESPDRFYDSNNVMHIYKDSDAVTFGYFNGVLYTTLEPDDRWQKEVVKNQANWTHDKLGDWIAAQIDDEKIPEPVNWDYDHPYIGRDDLEFPGRLWSSQKVISFWDYPKSAHELKTIVQDINKKVKNKFRITDDWRIDLGFGLNPGELNSTGNEITPISSYKSSKESKPADKGQAHIAFGKQGNVPSGVGSKFKFKNQQSGETVAQMRARLKTSESKITKSNTMKKSELQQIIREEVEKVLNEQNKNISSVEEKIQDYIKNGSKGDLDLRGTLITSLPNNLKVGRDLWLGYSKITSLPNDLQVGGRLDLRGTLITSLPDNLKVGGDLWLGDSKITSLPNDLQVEGSLYLRNTKITSLPNNLKVEGSLDLGHTKITSLPNNLQVGGGIYLEDTKITSLPNNLKVRGDLNLMNTLITSLPNDLQVGLGLNLRNTLITSLPNNLKVGVDLYLGNSKITSLPDNLKVRGNLNLSNTGIASLPNDLYVGVDLDLSNTPLSRKYSKNEIKKMIEYKGGYIKGNIYT